MIILLLRWVLIRDNKVKERARAELAAATIDEEVDDLKATGGPAANDTTFSDLTCVYVIVCAASSRSRVVCSLTVLDSTFYTTSDKQNINFRYVY